MFIQLFYFLLYTISLTRGKLEIRDANVAALSRDEIGMIFYITVENSNFCPYEVKVNMIECTEVISDLDRDASFMYLVGGHMGVLKPHCFKNITIIYPNMYVHNRRGFCLIAIKFKNHIDEVVQKKVNISFDTYISKHGSAPVMRGYYRRSEVTTCTSPDLDPLNRCKPVDCPMKYLGTRNFFSKHSLRCGRVPICVSDPKKDMPDLMYSPSTNKCRDMERTVTKQDLQTIDAGLVNSSYDMYYSNINLNCHFGNYNNQTGKCDCRSGWISAPLDKSMLPSPGLLTFHMCNIESTDWYDTDSRKLKLICLIAGILAVLLAMIIILCSFLIQLCYNCIKSFEETGKDGTARKGRAKQGKMSRVKYQMHKTADNVMHPLDHWHHSSRHHSKSPHSHRSHRSHSSCTHSCRHSSRHGSHTTGSPRSPRTQQETSMQTSSEPSTKSYRDL